MFKVGDVVISSGKYYNFSEFQPKESTIGVVIMIDEDDDDQTCRVRWEAGQTRTADSESWAYNDDIELLVEFPSKEEMTEMQNVADISLSVFHFLKGLEELLED